jgi:hypothetical protein
MKRAILFTADARLRESKKTLDEKMPWLKTEVLYDPGSVMSVASEEPSVFLLDDAALAIIDSDKIRAGSKDAVIVLLSFQPYVHCSPPQAASQKFPYVSKADLVFAAGGNEFAPGKILPSVVRAAEDLLNIGRYSRVRRFIFHLVDDEPRWFSQFLPVLYDIIGQRADVMISRTYEESLRFIFGLEDESRISPQNYLAGGRGDDIVCLITDIFFPRGDDLQSSAGRDLIRLVNKFYPRVPVIIASKAKEALALRELGFILPKGDPGSLQKLRDYILNFTGLGDFLIYDQDGREMHRLKDIAGICRILLEAEKDTKEGSRLCRILESYGDKDKFSTWLYMHGYREVGDRLLPRRSRGRELITILKRNLKSEILRMKRTPLVIGGRKIFTLSDLFASLRTLTPEIIQPYSDDDIISSWLDRKGFPELAEELRPIHGSGAKLSDTLSQAVEKWMKIYRETGRDV